MALRRAARVPRLWAWLFAAASCTLLDELVIALAALRLHRERLASAALASGAAVAFTLGSILGTALADRAVARAGRRVVLLVSAAVTLAALGIVVAPTSTSFVASIVALFVVGCACAPHHPLALARAYDALPGRPGVVQAWAQLFVAIEVVAPLALGCIADRWGLSAALACLAIQPLVIAACALVDA